MKAAPADVGARRASPGLVRCLHKYCYLYFPNKEALLLAVVERISPFFRGLSADSPDADLARIVLTTRCSPQRVRQLKRAIVAVSTLIAVFAIIALAVLVLRTIDLERRAAIASAEKTANARLPSPPQHWNVDRAEFGPVSGRVCSTDRRLCMDLGGRQCQGFSRFFSRVPCPPPMAWIVQLSGTSGGQYYVSIVIVDGVTGRTGAMSMTGNRMN